MKYDHDWSNILPSHAWETIIYTLRMSSCTESHYIQKVTLSASYSYIHCGREWFHFQADMIPRKIGSACLYHIHFFLEGIYYIENVAKNYSKWHPYSRSRIYIRIVETLKGGNNFKYHMAPQVLVRNSCGINIHIKQFKSKLLCAVKVRSSLLL